MKKISKASGWKGRRTEKGFTLMELTFSVALLALLGLSLFGILNAANQIFYATDAYSQQNDAAMQVLRSVGRELSETSSLVSPSHLSVTDGIDDSHVVTFQVPVDYDNDGDVVTSSMNPVVEWGSYDDVGQGGNGDLGGYIRYQLEDSPNAAEGNRLVRQVLDSGQGEMEDLKKILATNVVNFQLNRDSGQTDRYTILMDLEKHDEVKGGTYETSFEHTVYIRNNVS